MSKEDSYSISESILYALFIIFIASTIIFTRESNLKYGNILDVLFLSYFGVLQILNPQKRYYINSIIIIYTLFLAYAFLSIFWTVDPFFTKFTSKRILFVLINMIVIYNVLKIYKFDNAIFIGISIGIFYNVLLARHIIEVGYELYGSAAGIESVRFSGSTFQPNMLGGIALFNIMGMSYLIYKSKSKFAVFLYFIMIVLSYYLMLLAISRSSMILGLIPVSVILFYLYSKKEYRKVIVSTLLIITILLIYFIDLDHFMNILNNVLERLSGLFSSDLRHKDDSTLERMKLLHMAIEIYKNNPFFGTGLDTMRVLLFDGLYSHNNYVEILASIGPIGLILYYSIHIVVIKKILLVRDFWLKVILLSNILVILLFDIAGVNYYSKYVLFYLLLFSYISEENLKKIYKTTKKAKKILYK